jgi:RNA polymerase sigma-70 factor (sigma-E family)
VCVYTCMEGFEEWAHARLASLARAAFLLTGDVHLAEDLAQETLVRVAMQWRRKEGAAAPDALARVVMYRIAVDGWRRRGSRPREVLGAVPDRGATAPSVEDGLVLRDALGRLTAKQRAVVALRFYEDLTEAQVAQVLGVSVSTVKSQTRAALVRLRSAATEVWVAFGMEEVAHDQG